MRILTGIDLPFLPSCGSLILCDDLYGKLPDQDHVQFLALQPPTATSWSQIEDVILLDVPKEIDPAKYDSYVAALLAKINQQVMAFKPDIIHIQHLGFGMALAFSQLKHIPKMAICHGTDVLFSITDEFHRKNMELVARAADMIIFPAESMYDEFRKLVPFEVNYRIVPWGIPDIQRDVAHVGRGSNQAGFNLLYAGRLSEDKNVKVIIEALSFVDSAITLTIIGEGDQRASLEALAQSRNLAARVVFKDFLPRAQLWAEFPKYDALVVSTTQIEAFCLTAVEAQAHGLPVIYANIGTLLEIIGESGIAFESNNSHDLAEQINRLQQQPDQIARYSSAGISNASEFTIAQTAKRMRSLSRELIKT